MKTYNYNRVLNAKPYTLMYYRGIRLVEHPLYGEEAPVVALYKGKAWCTGYDDPQREDGALLDIWEQAQEIA